MEIKDLSVELDAKAAAEVVGGGDVTVDQSNKSTQYAEGVQMITKTKGFGNVTMGVAANQQYAEQANLSEVFNKDEHNKIRLDLF